MNQIKSRPKKFWFKRSVQSRSVVSGMSIQMDRHCAIISCATCKKK